MDGAWPNTRAGPGPIIILGSTRCKNRLGLAKIWILGQALEVEWVRPNSNNEPGPIHTLDLFKFNQNFESLQVKYYDWARPIPYFEPLQVKYEDWSRPNPHLEPFQA